MRTSVGPYDLGEVLGSGGMGVVYRATQAGLRRPVALKLLAARVGQEPGARYRFLREMRVLAQLSHPNIVQVFDGGLEDDVPFIAMELIEGTPLQRVISSAETRPLSEKVRIGAALADALAYVHAEGILHRDIKPSNILLTADGVPKIIDFGVARGVDATVFTAAGMAVGTMLYLAPELFKGQSCSAAGDIWSLGCVLYELFSGRQCHPLVERVTKGAISSPRVLVPALPADLDQLIMGMLAEEPAHRPPAVEVQRHLVALLSELSLEMPHPERKVQRRGYREIVAAAVGAGVLLGLVARSFRPVAAVPPEAGARSVRPAANTGSAAAAATAANTFRQLLLAWRSHLDERPRLMAGGSAALAARDRLARVVPVSMGRRPEHWLYWLEMGRWVELARADLKPPRYPWASHGTMDEYQAMEFFGAMRTMHWVRAEEWLENYPHLVGYTGANPDDTLCWLVMGRLYELAGLVNEATFLYGRLVRSTVASTWTDWPAICWNALARALIRVPGRNIEQEWPRWVARLENSDDCWDGLAAALTNEDRPRLKRLLQAGAQVPGHSAAVQRQLERLR